MKYYNIDDVMTIDNVKIAIDGRNLGEVRDYLDLFMMENVKKSANLYCGENVSKYIQFSNYFNIYLNKGNNFGKWKFGTIEINLFHDKGLGKDYFRVEYE